MNARQTANRLNKVDEIIEKDEYNNYHTWDYMENVYKEQQFLEKQLYWLCA